MTAPDEVWGPWCPEGARARFGRRAFAHPPSPDALVWEDKNSNAVRRSSIPKLKSSAS